MAISITWPTPTNGYVGVIHVPKADTVLIDPGPPEIRSLNVNQLRGDVGALWASTEGAPYYKPFTHSGEVTTSGFTYARQITFHYAVEFEDGQYVVRLAGGNHNILDVISSNQVSVQVQNSAGLVNVLQLYDIAYLGQIHFDEMSGLPPGSQDPYSGHGTPQQPISTLADLIALSQKTGLRSCLILNGTLQLATQDFLDWRFELTADATLDLNGRGCHGSSFRGGTVEGTATGTCAFDLCRLSSVSGVNFLASQCIFLGTTTPATGTSTFNFCTSGIPGATTPVLDLSSGPISCSVRSYSGGLEVQNSTDPNNVMTLEYIAGQFKAFSTVTQGTFVLRGDCYPVNTTGATATIVNNVTSKVVWEEFVANQRTALITAILQGALPSGETVESTLDLLRKVQSNRLEATPGAPGVLTLYDDDGITPIKTWEVYDYLSGAVTGVPGAPALRGAAT